MQQVPDTTRWCADVCNPPPIEQDYHRRMEGPDRGVINAWLAGLELRASSPQLVKAAKAGELPLLAYRGGVDRALKGDKVGSLLYLAMWQGLRGENLDVDTSLEPVLTCAKHGVSVRFVHGTAQLLLEDVE